jgi:Flp pilus assembly protein TadD
VEPALREYRASLALIGDEPLWASLRTSALNHLGTTLANAGRTEEAAVELRLALEHDPRNVDATANLAVLSYKRRDLAAARDLALRALALDPSHGMALQVLGTARLLLGDGAGALQAFEQAVAADPDDPVRRFNLGLAYSTLGRGPEACAAWREVASLRPPANVVAQTREQAARAGCSGR